MNRLPLAAVAFVLAFVAACETAAETPPTATPTTAGRTSAHGDCVAVGSGKEGPLQVTVEGSTVCWRDLDGESAYELSASLQYYADCAAWRSGDLAASPFDLTEALPAGSTHFELPGPRDRQFSVLKDVSVTIRALDEAGRQIAVDGVAVQREIDYPAMCGASSPAATP